MKVSDYIVEFLLGKGITDAFGYPGGSVSNLIDSFRKYEPRIRAHVVYHEQAAAFAASAYAQTSGLPGVAYATGGPGATNLLTGIGHAFYDSIPIVCITGNVNTYEAKGDMDIRQRGFQESDIVSVAKPLTKYCAYVQKPEEIRYYLEKAFATAVSGRPGPVLLDIPMDVQRAQIDVEGLRGSEPEKDGSGKDGKPGETFRETVKGLLAGAERPCLVIGNGAKAGREALRTAVERLGIPYVTSMIAFDVLGDNPYYQGFIGAYGIRAANFVVAKSDLVIAIGARLDVRQVGAIRENFAPNAKIIRVDLDAGELAYKVHADEYGFCMDAREALAILADLDIRADRSPWLAICAKIREKLSGFDDTLPNTMVRALSAMVPANTVITTDVGQNQVWVPQSFALKDGQQVLFSGGMGSMGHALPAAVGAFYGSGGKPVVSMNGDGGLQMNIQELQFIARERLPVKIIVFNNMALGMIRVFQEMYFDRNYYQTRPSGGYTVPDFAGIAKAYKLRSAVVRSVDELESVRGMLCDGEPALIEIRIEEDTYVHPKLEFGKPNQDQQPLIDRALYNELMAL